MSRTDSSVLNIEACRKAMTVRCPVCRAPTGEPCVTLVNEVRLQRPHIYRMREAKRNSVKPR